MSVDSGQAQTLVLNELTIITIFRSRPIGYVSFVPAMLVNLVQNFSAIWMQASNHHYVMRISLPLKSALMLSWSRREVLGLFVIEMSRYEITVDLNKRTRPTGPQLFCTFSFEML